MPRVISAADLVLCRAGTTLSEIAAAAKPALIVPSPNVTGNHQEKNARVIEGRGAAVVMRESECTGEGLLEAVLELLGDREKLQTMSENMMKIAVLDATERIYKTINDLTR